MQADPIGYDAGPNWYVYVGNDPLNNIDPLGLRAENWWATKRVNWYEGDVFGSSSSAEGSIVVPGCRHGGVFPYCLDAVRQVELSNQNGTQLQRPGTNESGSGESRPAQPSKPPAFVCNAPGAPKCPPPASPKPKPNPPIPAKSDRCLSQATGSPHGIHPQSLSRDTSMAAQGQSRGILGDFMRMGRLIGGIPLYEFAYTYEFCMNS